MAQLLIRGMEESEIQRLKRHAQENERSLEAEARLALKVAARRPTAEERGVSRSAFREWALRMQQQLEGRWRSDSTELIRRARDER